MEPSKRWPFLSPLMAMLDSRKGIVVVVVAVSCFVAVMLGKTQFAEIKEFLGALLVAYFGSQAYEDSKKNEVAAKAVPVAVESTTHVEPPAPKP